MPGFISKRILTREESFDSGLVDVEIVSGQTEKIEEIELPGTSGIIKRILCRRVSGAALSNFNVELGEDVGITEDKRVQLYETTGVDRLDMAGIVCGVWSNSGSIWVKVKVFVTTGFLFRVRIQGSITGVVQ